MTIKNLVLAGAQLKAIAYLGVIKALVEYDLMNNIENICGVSSGSIIALLICIHLEYSQYEEIVYKILKIENLKTFKSSEIFNILSSYGLETGENIKKIIYYLIEKQTGNRYCTFKELKKKYPSKNLIILGANITSGKEEYFSALTTPGMEICDAIRISISVPFIFTSVKYNGLMYGDGGIINNFPLDYFEKDIEKTVGCCVSFLGDNTDITTFPTYISRIFNIIVNIQQNIMIGSYKENILNIVVPYHSIIDTLSIDEHKTTLINSGYNQFIKNIKKLPIFETIRYKFIIKDILDDIIGKIIS